MDMPRYERIWMTVGMGSLALFLIILGVLSFGMGLHPPDSKEKTTVPENVDQHPPFDKPGVYKVGPNEYEVIMTSFVFSYEPREIRIPKGAKVHFKVTSKDVVHGIYVPNTNVNLMLVPGHVTEYTYTFDETGEHLFLCHEYCGTGHQLMQGRIIVYDPENTTS
ncbi:MAG: cupredoxin domain-containing protein [Bacillaceae bacterium]|nr:cupredoxin domain-containing protein [Bacillaceae bacterium]